MSEELSFTRKASLHPVAGGAAGLIYPIVLMALALSGGFRQGGDLSTRLILETEPPGVLVVYENRILGKTPLDEVLPLAVEGPVGLQLTGPYFKTWLGQVQGDEEIRVQVALTKGR